MPITTAARRWARNGRARGPAGTSRTRPVLLGLTLLLGGCGDLTGNPGLPAGTPNPAYYNTAQGAVGLRDAAILSFETAWGQYLIDSGLLTDELQDANTVPPGIQKPPFSAGLTVTDPLDQRVLPVGTTGGITDFGDLNDVRANVSLAVGALAAYDTATPQRDSVRILRGELYAVEGYAEIMLADLFCSGVPLSTLDFQKSFTYQPSSTTVQVYQDAITKFDTALTLAAGTSDSVQYLAQVGLGRAYLDLGEYRAAADDVQDVPTSFVYSYYAVLLNEINSSGSLNSFSFREQLSDHEGINGLPFLSSGDPRVQADTVVLSSYNAGEYFPGDAVPSKYVTGLSGNGLSPITVASGVEARLIQAEAAFNGVPTGNGTWLTQLNALRATLALPAIAVPADSVAQIDTLFTERAYWLWLTGHRQGDLRRLMRNYGPRPGYRLFEVQQAVYPTGVYYGAGGNEYGNDVVVPIPVAESVNQYFHGCLNDDP